MPSAKNTIPTSVELIDRFYIQKNEVRELLGKYYETGDKTFRNQAFGLLMHAKGKARPLLYLMLRIQIKAGVGTMRETALAEEAFGRFSERFYRPTPLLEEKFDPAKGDFFGWVYTVLKNDLRKVVRLAKRDEARFVPLGAGKDMDINTLLDILVSSREQSDPVIQQLIKEELESALEEATLTLPTVTHRIVYQSMMDGSSNDEGAAALGVSLATYKRRKAEVIRHFAEALAFDENEDQE